MILCSELKNVQHLDKYSMKYFAKLIIGNSLIIGTIYVALALWGGQKVLIDMRSLVFVALVGFSYSLVTTQNKWVSLNKLGDGSVLGGVLGVAIGLSLTLPLQDDLQTTAWPFVFLPLIYGLVFKIICDGLNNKKSSKKSQE